MRLHLQSSIPIDAHSRRSKLVSVSDATHKHFTCADAVSLLVRLPPATCHQVSPDHQDSQCHVHVPRSRKAPAAHATTNTLALCFPCMQSARYSMYSLACNDGMAWHGITRTSYVYSVSLMLPAMHLTTHTAVSCCVCQAGETLLVGA